MGCRLVRKQLPPLAALLDVGRWNGAQIVVLLLDNGAATTIDSTDINGDTPLHFAAIKYTSPSRMFCVSALQQSFLSGRKQHCLLHFFFSGKDEAAELLAARGANIEIRGGEHHSDCYQITAESVLILSSLLTTSSCLIGVSTSFLIVLVWRV